VHEQVRVESKVHTSLRKVSPGLHVHPCGVPSSLLLGVENRIGQHGPVREGSWRTGAK
jgi:hypothetical protein